MQTRGETVEAELHHGPPLAQAGQRLEADLQFIELQGGGIQRRGGNRAGSQGQTPGTKPAVIPELDGVSEGGAERCLQRLPQLVHKPDGRSIQQVEPCRHSESCSERAPQKPWRGWNSSRSSHQTRRSPLQVAQYKEPSCGTPLFMALDPLLISAVPWLGWAGLGLALLTVVAFLAGWGLRFRLVGVSSFTLLLAVSCWAFGVSYTPPVVVEGAIRAPVVFDNGTDLVVAQAPADLESATITATLEQLAGNLRSAGRGSGTVTVRLRAFESPQDGLSRPVILGETVRDFRPGEI